MLGLFCLGKKKKNSGRRGEREKIANNVKEKVMQPELKPDTMKFWSGNFLSCRDATEAAILFAVMDPFRSHCTLHVTCQVLLFLRFLLCIFLVCFCLLTVAFCLVLGPISALLSFPLSLPWLGLDPFLHSEHLLLDFTGYFVTCPIHQV